MSIENNININEMLVNPEQYSSRNELFDRIDNLKGKIISIQKTANNRNAEGLKILINNFSDEINAIFKKEQTTDILSKINLNQFSFNLIPAIRENKNKKICEEVDKILSIKAKKAEQLLHNQLFERFDQTDQMRRRVEFVNNQNIAFKIIDRFSKDYVEDSNVMLGREEINSLCDNRKVKIFVVSTIEKRIKDNYEKIEKNKQEIKKDSTGKEVASKLLEENKIIEIRNEAYKKMLGLIEEFGK